MPETALTPEGSAVAGTRTGAGAGPVGEPVDGPQPGVQARTGLYARLGEPFAHALSGRPLGTLRWGLVLTAGALLAAAAIRTDHLTGSTPSGLGTTLAWALLLAVLPLLVTVDAALHMLPNRVLYPTALGCTVLLVGDWATGGLSAGGLLRAGLVAVALFVFSFAVVLIAPAGGYGLGDVRLVTIAGLVLGTHSWWLPIAALVIAPPLLAISPAVLVMVATRGKTTGIAFGPWIALGVWLAAFAQPVLVGLAP